jgi:hypothetical protein
MTTEHRALSRTFEHEGVSYVVEQDQYPGVSVQRPGAALPEAHWFLRAKDAEEDEYLTRIGSGEKVTAEDAEARSRAWLKQNT